MTKKDYELIARVMARSRPVNFMNSNTTWDVIVAEFCNELPADNPRFNKERFIATCCLMVDSQERK